MLSAEKEEQRLQTVTSGPNFGSFGKVVNSIDGLQQQLDALALDEIIKAEDKARSLNLCLSRLQNKLDVLANIKERVTAAGEAIEQISIPSLDPAEFEPLHKPLHLHSIAPTSKLIPFPRPNRAAKERPKFVAIEPLDKETQPAPAKIGTPAGWLRPSTEDAQSAEPTAAPGGLEKSGAPSLPGEMSDIPASDQATASLEIPKAYIRNKLATLFSDNSPSADSVPAPAEAIRDLEEPASGATELNATTTADDVVEAGEHAEPTRATAGSEIDFDQQLLDDLIKNYGEFTASRNLPAAIEPPKTAESRSSQQGVAAAFRKTTQDIRKSNLPSNKRESDINRQLKKIIKDYGEYDLYAPQSPVSLKTAVIIAFVLLGLVFSGFYFFSSPITASPPAVARFGSAESNGSTPAPGPQDPLTPRSAGSETARPARQVKPVR
jgi:hypothetical protein